MNRFTRRLGPATPSAALCCRGSRQVNVFEHRAAFRCIHSGSDGDTGRTPSDDQAKSSRPKKVELSMSAKTPSVERRGEEKDFRLAPKRRGNENYVPKAIASLEKSGGGIPPIRKVGSSLVRLTLAPEETTGLVKGGRSLIRKIDVPLPLNDAPKSSHKSSNIPYPSPIEVAISRYRMNKLDIPSKDDLQRSCTVEYDFPGNATKANLLLSLTSMIFNRAEWQTWQKHAGRQAIIFLFTPGLATLVENDATLIPDILSRLTRMPEWSGQDPFEFDVVCACVDGLAPGPEMLARSRGRRPKEGFSILHGSQQTILPSVCASSGETLSKSPSMQSSITLRKGQHGLLDVTLPLANTLFKNGRLSTLLVSSWRYDAAKAGFVTTRGPVEKANVVVNVLSEVASRSPSIFIPAVPLTPARPIVSGLGNIVRSIDFGGEEGHGPASRELEAAVPEYLDAMRYGNTPIEVWALVVPPRIRSGLPDGEPQNSALPLAEDNVQSKWKVHVDLGEESDYIGFWIKTRKAKFCRVLSGGGGWGVKQGLLSLDPQTTYSEVPEARYDLSGGSFEDQQTSALGNIAQEGAFIQFFAARRKRPQVPATRNGKYQSFLKKSRVFGAVPSTVDDIPSSPSFKGGYQSLLESIHLRQGHFGFVSESGMFLRHESDDKDDATSDSSTKIDMPYSYLCVDYQLDSKVSKSEPMVQSFRRVAPNDEPQIARKVAPRRTAAPKGHGFVV